MLVAVLGAIVLAGDRPRSRPAAPGISAARSTPDAAQAARAFSRVFFTVDGGAWRSPSWPLC